MAPEPSFFGRLRATVKLELSTLPFLLGMKEPAENFRHLGRGGEDVPA